MDYLKHYNNLISKARNRKLQEYKEVHHVVPRCMGGTDDKENLVELTPEEHYIAHQLLVKIYPTNIKLVRAAVMMIPKRPSNKLYGWLKRKFSDIQSDSQTGSGNTQFGTRWIHNTNLKISKKILKGEELPIGWIEGRIIKFDKPLKVKKKDLNKEQMLTHTIYHFKKYIESDCESLNEYCKLYYDYSLVTFTKRLKEYIPEYNTISKQGGHNIKEILMGVKL